MLNLIPILELPVLIIMVLIRSIILRRHGIKAFVFGATNKTDFFLIPAILFFFYGILSTFINLPFPNVLINLFWRNDIITVCAIVICSLSLVWFGVTLKIFGRSFRVGIDEKTNDKLITTGTFSISRNPIYLAFIVFFTGIFAAFPNIISSVFLALFAIVIHRQILREEKFLKSHYGGEYDEYCNLTPRYLFVK